MGIPTLYSVGPSSGTFTAAPTANRIGVYLYAGGGGGTGGGAGGGPGGVGGFGFVNKPIAQPFSQPFSVGGGGGAGPANGNGNAGGNTILTNVATFNGGAAGSGPATGAAGNAPGASLTYPTRSFIVGGAFGNLGGGGFRNPDMSDAGNYNPGNNGTGGVLVVFENTGT
jgi:hypothetical protein